MFASAEPDLERYCVRYDIVLQVYESSDEFRDRMSRSAILLLDKQQDSADFSECHEIVTRQRHGQTSVIRASDIRGPL